MGVEGERCSLEGENISFYGVHALYLGVCWFTIINIIDYLYMYMFQEGMIVLRI